MIIIRVELWSAVTGEVTEIARMGIDNIGGDVQRGDYRCQTYRGRDQSSLARRVVQREGRVLGHLRLKLHVWNLVAKALTSMGYGLDKPPPADLFSPESPAQPRLEA